MPDLLPTDLEESTLEENELAKSLDGEEGLYKRSIYFSNNNGDFITDSSGRFKEATEVETWIQWCIKVLETPRYECLAYSTDIGIDLEEVFEAEDRDAAEAALSSEITEALTADPYGRTDYVNDITFNWISPDSVKVSCEIVGTDGAAENIEAVINA